MNQIPKQIMANYQLSHPLDLKQRVRVVEDRIKLKSRHYAVGNEYYHQVELEC